MLPILFAALLWVVSSEATCPLGTIYENTFNKCYKYVNEPLGFLSAEQNCISIGGHLVSVSNAFENAFISELVSQRTSSASPSKYWIGANLLMNSNWTWTTHEELSFTNWALGQPSDPSVKQCGAVMNSDNLKEICNSALPFVCAVDVNISTVSTQPPSTCPPCPSSSCGNAVCTDGYQLFPGTCRCYKYYKHDVVIHFSDAEKQCANENGTLAKITSDELNDFLFSLWIKYPDYEPWIGIRCQSSEIASCSWPDGSSAERYSHFEQGYPTGGMASTYMWKDSYWKSDTRDQGDGVLCENAPLNIRNMLDSN